MIKRVTTATFNKMKQEKQKITMLTAYDYPTAKIMDKCNIDAILVGDSLGMVVLGYTDTTQVTMEDMLHHTKAVTRGVEHALVVSDMPFLSYHIGIEQSIINAGRLIRDGRAQAVKLEGGREVSATIKAIVAAGIPVMGHLGLTPQSINAFGGYFIQGKTSEQARKIIEDAKILEEAGVFAIVLECIPSELAKLITAQLSVPTIGIGAGVNCDGQVLVNHDILALYQNKSPSFVKQYCQLGNSMENAFKQYITDVKTDVFPSEEHSFHGNIDILDNIYGGEK